MASPGTLKQPVVAGSLWPGSLFRPAPSKLTFARSNRGANVRSLKSRRTHAVAAKQALSFADIRADVSPAAIPISERGGSLIHV